jgi:hypothetical protein
MGISPTIAPVDIPLLEDQRRLMPKTPSAGLVRNLNPDFNTVRVQAIMETIQRMTPDGSPLALLAQQGVEVANLVAAEKSAGVPQRKPSVGHNNWARHA